MTELRKSPSVELKAQVAKIKNDLPHNIKTLIIEKFPEYDTKKGTILIQNVLAGRTADLRLTEILKSYAFINKLPKQTEIPQASNQLEIK